jgi:hypothetical protein
VVTRGGWWILCATAGCTIGGVHALPPEPRDADPPPDAAATDVYMCDPSINGDGDELGDCAELDDGDDFTDPMVFNGLTATIGDRPEWTGSCDWLDDFDEMIGRFDGSTQVMDVWAGWEFDTDADSYDDPSYGFQPGWPSAQSGRFSVRFNGRIRLAADGTHCFSIDVGATGTDIIGGKNMCAQIYVDGRPGGAWLAETGYGADSVDADVGCVDLPAGDVPLDIVFWYFNVLERAQLTVRACTGAAPCAPDRPLDPVELQAIP